MARLSPKYDALRALFARSGNQCAFPGCTQSLINSKNQFIGQLCHIEAATPGGQRYNPDQADEERRAYDNLLLLCYPHHVESNYVGEYPVATIKQIKKDHEAIFKKNLFKIDEAVLHKIADEMDLFWKQIEKLNKIEHSMKEFAVDINSKGTYFDIMEECRKNIQYLQGFFDTFRETEQNIRSNSDYHYIGVPNRMNRLRIHLIHMEIKYLEEYIKTHVDNISARKKLNLLKDQFKEIAHHETVID